MKVLKIIRAIRLTAIVLMFAQKATAQKMDQPLKFKKTAVYGNVGFLGLYVTATAYVERTLWDWNKKWEVKRTLGTVEKSGRVSQFLRAGAGVYGSYDGGSKYYLLQTGFVFGPGKNHFEMAFGGGYFLYENKPGGYYLPTGTLGYRRQMPESNLVVRMGVGYPESAYLGFGFCF